MWLLSCAGTRHTLVFFFFSSRRRHTRLQGDWSSDVCSSDLRSMPRATTMNLSEAVAISASSLWAHKLRSVLTLIGVVIGVAAVIAVVSLINEIGRASCRERV